MHESARRVALLARPGAARERLHSALVQVGAELVLEGDPAQLDPAEIAATRPEVVLVALDPATEQALDRFETVLEDPAIEVMFEEADVAAHREGWDAARWIRHLAAKLHRHADVLPSAAGREAPPAMAMPAVAEPRAESVPAVASTPEAAPEPLHVDLPSAVGRQPALPTLDADEPAITPLAEPVPAHPLSDEFTPGVDAGAFTGFDPVAAEMADAEDTADQIVAFDFQLDEALPLEAVGAGDDGAPHLDLVFESELALPLDAGDATPHPVLAPDGALQLDDLSLDDLRDERAAEPASLDFALDTGFVLPDELPAAPAAGGAVARPAFELSLDDAPVAVLDDAAAPGAPRPARDLADIERRIASLELVDDGPAAPAADTIVEHVSAPAASTGAVLVFAGIGGPDAVRQLLGALPVPFPRPVLVQQRLDGGRYDKLVAQLQRATTLPVALAEAGAPVSPGTVYIMPATLGVAAADGGLRFDDDAPLLGSLPPADSAVLLLSGSDPANVDAIADAAREGAFVAGQADEGCYDPAAPNALAARGGATGQPTELARQLAERWGPA